MPKKILSNQEKFRAVIEKIVSGIYDKSSGKAQLTKIIDQWEKEEIPFAIKGAIQETLSCFPK